MESSPREWWNRTREFLTDVRTEMKKVSWPSRDEVLGTTVVVVIVTFIFGIFLAAVDLVFFRLIQYMYKAFGV